MKKLYKGLLLAIYSIGLGNLSWGQCFNQVASYSAGPGSVRGVGTSAVATGDFNRDGKTDIITTNSNTVSVLLNTGGGVFGAPTSFPAGPGLQAIVVSDFNGDNKLDIATSNESSDQTNLSIGSISILLGDGNGRFSAPSTIALELRGTSLVAGDFNGDNKPDLVVIHRNYSTISVLLNNGKGGFGLVTSYFADDTVNSIVVSDLNADGRLDLAAATNYAISILLGNGVGGFGKTASTIVSTRGIHSLTGGDFNNDGKPDLIVANNSLSGQEISVLINDGNAAFKQNNYFAFANLGQLTVGDFNADGVPDIAMSTLLSDSYVLVSLNDGGGVFSRYTPFDIASSSGPTGFLSVASVDLNNDGKSDLIANNLPINTVSVLLACTTPPSALVLIPPTYDCTTGQLSLSATGGNGSQIDYRIVGLRNWATSNTFTVPIYQRNGTSFTLEARQSGTVVSLPFLTACQSTTPTNPDLGPLVDFYNSTNGANWTNHTNWLTGNNPCNWYGVTCDGNGRVTDLRFNQNSLNGILPASLGNLSQLKSLTIFQEPNLSGTLPTSLGNLTQLQSLNIEYTQISGSIPESLGNLTQLKSLFLAVNKLTGTIPASLGNLPQLQNLYLFINQLTGCIPNTFSALCGKDVRLYANDGLPGGGDFSSFCSSGAGACQSTPPTNTGLTFASLTYDCATGQLALSTTGGNGTLVEFRVAGLRDWAASNSFSVPSYQRIGTSFTLEARQNGTVVNLAFTSACQSTTTTPPVNPPTATPLTVATQAFNCQTGALQLVATGGDGTAIEFKVPGLRDYNTSASFTVPTYQRQNTAFTLYARQSGREVTASYSVVCSVAGRLASVEPVSALEVVVYPNPVGEQFTVGVSGANGQSVRFHLTNLNGQTVVEQRAQVESDKHTETLRVPASNAGMYLLQVSTDTQSKTVKVLKP